jgi:hypothetical protein
VKDTKQKMFNIVTEYMDPETLQDLCGRILAWTMVAMVPIGPGGLPPKQEDEDDNVAQREAIRGVGPGVPEVQQEAVEGAEEVVPEVQQPEVEEAEEVEPEGQYPAAVGAEEIVPIVQQLAVEGAEEIVPEVQQPAVEGAEEVVPEVRVLASQYPVGDRVTGRK